MTLNIEILINVLVKSLSQNLHLSFFRWGGILEPSISFLEQSYTKNFHFSEERWTLLFLERFCLSGIIWYQEIQRRDTLEISNSIWKQRHINLSVLTMRQLLNYYIRWNLPLITGTYNHLKVKLRFLIWILWLYRIDHCDVRK